MRTKQDQKRCETPCRPSNPCPRHWVGVRIWYDSDGFTILAVDFILTQKTMAHIVDTALEKRALEGKPVRVGLVGAGFMAKGLVLQIEKVIGL